MEGLIFADTRRIVSMLARCDRVRSHFGSPDMQLWQRQDISAGGSDSEVNAVGAVWGRDHGTTGLTRSFVANGVQVSVLSVAVEVAFCILISLGLSGLGLSYTNDDILTSNDRLDG
jgi:hypothetical protein